MGGTNPICAVVFDLDDTLYPEREYVRSGYRAVGEHLRIVLGRSEAFEEWLWARFQRGMASGAFDALNEHFRLNLTPQEIEPLVATYRGHRPRIHPYSGAAAMLSQLRGEHALGLLSDGFMPAQAMKLEALGLARFFSAVVFTEELGRSSWKPSRDGFEKIRALLGVSHERCAYVADNPAKDFVAPNALGWRTIQLLHPGQIHTGKPAPEGGEPQFTAHLPGEVCQALLEEATQRHSEQT